MSFHLGAGTLDYVACGTPNLPPSMAYLQFNTGLMTQLACSVISISFLCELYGSFQNSTISVI